MQRAAQLVRDAADEVPFSFVRAEGLELGYFGHDGGHEALEVGGFVFGEDALGVEGPGEGGGVGFAAGMEEGEEKDGGGVWEEGADFVVELGLVAGGGGVMWEGGVVEDGFVGWWGWFFGEGEDRALWVEA